MDTNYLSLISNFKKICRLCLLLNDDLFLIFNGDCTLSEQILQYLDIKVLVDDVAPLRICRECKITIDNWITFKTACIKANNLIQQHVTRVKQVEMKSLMSDKYKENKDPVLKHGSFNLLTPDCCLYDSFQNNVKQVHETISEQQKHEKDKKCAEDTKVEKNVHKTSPEKETIVKESDKNEVCQRKNQNGNVILKICRRHPVRRKKPSLLKKKPTIKRRIRLKKRKYECELCNSHFTRFCDLLDHDDIYHDSLVKSHICSVCGKLFMSENRVKIHKNMYHSEKQFKCDICKKNFYSKNTIRVHMNKHKNLYLCNYCGYSAITNTQLIQHIFVHTQEKLFSCEKCGKTFNSRQGLNHHIQTHVNGKLFKCDICGVLVSNNRGLRVHKETHNSTSNKSFVCKTCGKSFKSNIRLYEHDSKVHKPPKKEHQCSICFRVFRQYYMLVKHQKVHTGEKPYSCNICDRSFARNDTLKEHIRTHTREKKYTCHVCLQQFCFLKPFKTHKCKTNDSISNLNLTNVGLNESLSPILANFDIHI